MESSGKIKLVECPRDAMQGLNYFIATEDKINYLDLLLRVGFDTLDFGSFVSHKAVPQMADTTRVLEGLDLSNSSTRLLAIVANLKGAEEAVKHPSITFLGYPFSISETFQKRNTNTDISKSLSTVEELMNICSKSGKKAVIYLSMAFGNPYGDEWNMELIHYWTSMLISKGVSIISLSDTIGAATPELIAEVYKSSIHNFPDIEFGVHLHSTPDGWEEKINAAYQNGCKRFDSAIKGFGGCPMASDILTGNIATENLISFFNNHQENLRLDMNAFEKVVNFSTRIFH
ncbi:hydroxymethylglutaryl-CoA lyase [Pedobacter sp. P351]|uniref:hydroxymethylglutaryl-CoA lyase n=1 Tax=Pedobacter superstes TaxID=3133441 RepID=UPI0030A2D928